MIARYIDREPFKARWALIISVTGNLGILAYFKYFNFGVDSLNSLLSGLNVQPLHTWNVLLPIGISFYIFQATSYLVDVYRKDAPPARNFWDLSAFIALFPQLIAGPILRYKDLAGQFERRTHTLAKFSEGSFRFMVGFCKKVLIADGVAPIVDLTFGHVNPGFADAWLGALAYFVQLYFDFSGYSDMAIGLGLMMGFRFMENFNQPYISRSITEFWQRWHISLSAWLRDYLYIPLGGNRKSPSRTYINLMVVMLLGGLWHGANWTFVIWGGWHGGILAIERFLSRPLRWKAIPFFLAIPRTILLVIIGWVTFRAPSIGEATAFYGAMIGLNSWVLSEAITWQLQGYALFALVVGLILVFLTPLVQQFSSNKPFLEQRVLSINSTIIIPVFLLATLRLSAQSFSPFLYFQF